MSLILNKLEKMGYRVIRIVYLKENEKINGSVPTNVYYLYKDCKVGYYRFDTEWHRSDVIYKMEAVGNVLIDTTWHRVISKDEGAREHFIGLSDEEIHRYFDETAYDIDDILVQCSNDLNYYWRGSWTTDLPENENIVESFLKRALYIENASHGLLGRIDLSLSYHDNNLRLIVTLTLSQEPNFNPSQGDFIMPSKIVNEYTRALEVNEDSTVQDLIGQVLPDILKKVEKLMDKVLGTDWSYVVS